MPFNAPDTGDTDFFPGDITLLQGVQIRPSNKPYQIPKADVKCGTVAMTAAPLISYGQATNEGIYMMFLNFNLRPLVF